YYRQLLHQQREVLTSNADIDAFRYALQRFPSLARVTITPFAHGLLFTPLYETPMIRAFPSGFRYPTPRTWPVNSMYPYGSAYRVEGENWSDLRDSRKNIWRGFRIVARELAANPHHRITQLIIDDCHLFSGINCTIFTELCAEYHDLVALLRSPGFSRLDLALLTVDQWDEYRDALRSGHLRRALAEAPDMQHISLSTCETEPNAFLDIYDHEPNDPTFTPLSAIFPVEKWPRLRHFALSSVLVGQDDLLAFLGTLPATLRSVELVCLGFAQGSYQGLLEGMRASLDWRERAAGQRPTVTVGVDADKWRGRIVWATKEVDDFLYGEAPNPFDNPVDKGDMLVKGVGVERDPFDPEYEGRP
ncbi:hypothetical protein C8A05DRAFT_15672, partial [Staphylotrichum tortipilum]